MMRKFLALLLSGSLLLSSGAGAIEVVPKGQPSAGNVVTPAPGVAPVCANNPNPGISLSPSIVVAPKETGVPAQQYLEAVPPAASPAHEAEKGLIKAQEEASGLGHQAARPNADPASLHDSAGRLFDNQLSPEAVQALQAAAKDDYMVTLLKANIKNRDRLLVLLGETHIKTKESARVGERILEHFDYRGVEGVVYQGVLMRFLFAIKDSFSRHLQFATGRTSGSTMENVQSQAFRKDLERRFDSLSAEQAKELKAMPKGSSADFQKIKEWLFQVTQETPFKKIVNFELEEGHKKSFSEELDFIFLLASQIFPEMVLPASVGLGIFMAGMKVAPLYVIAPTVLMPALLCKYYKLGNILAEHFEDHKWFRVMFPMVNGLLRGRNKTMAANIVKNIEAASGLDKMLVIVGKAHVRGMKKILSRQYGFEEIPLPAPKSLAVQAEPAKSEPR